jgi:hypothetical protein
MLSQHDSLQYGWAPKNSFLELGIRITTLEREIIDQLQTITDEINDQMSALENQIPSLPISSENVYYTDMQKNTKMLNIYLNHIDLFKEQMLSILQNINKDIKNLQDTPVSDSIALPISAADVNYTKPDENTVPLDTFLEDIVTIEKVDAANSFVGISKVHELTEGADVQYSTYAASNKASFF